MPALQPAPVESVLFQKILEHYRDDYFIMIEVKVMQSGEGKTLGW